MVVVIVLVVWLISVYNNLVRMRNNRENAFANIDVQLKQRFDLIPQLVASVKGYATHEKEVFLQVTQARTATANAQSIDDKIKADNLLTSALQGLQSEISDIENKLAAARRFFNSATREYNNAVETFPGNIVAGFFKFHREGMYEIPEQQRANLEKAPEIKF